MKLGHYLSGLIKSELEDLERELNLTDEEKVVFDLLSKGKSIVYIADRCNISPSSVSNRIKSIQRKVVRYHDRKRNIEVRS